MIILFRRNTGDQKRLNSSIVTKLANEVVTMSAMIMLPASREWERSWEKKREKGRMEEGKQVESAPGDH